MVNDFRLFAAWSLGVIAALLAATLIDAGWHGGWALCLVLFMVVLLVSFWRPCGMACAEAIQFLQGALDARRVRKQIDESLPKNRLIIAPGDVVERVDEILARFKPRHDLADVMRGTATDVKER